MFVVESVGIGGVQDVELNDVLGVNMMFVVGFVMMIFGMVVEGNMFSDMMVCVLLGMMFVGMIVMIIFDVVIVVVFVFLIMLVVVNQVLVIGSNIFDELSDDLDIVSDDDLMVIFLGSGLVFDVFKSDMFVIDVDVFGGFIVGDMLEYCVEIFNFGGGVVNVVVFEDGLVVNVMFVVGLVIMIVGVVIFGNIGGDMLVEVDFGMFVGGSLVMIMFQVFFDMLFVGGVIEIVNQGMVCLSNYFDMLMDDFDIVVGDDLICIFIVGLFVFDSMKQDFFCFDVDGDSVFSLGDMLCYVFEVINIFVIQVIGVQVIDMFDVLMSLVNGMVMIL